LLAALCCLLGVLAVRGQGPDDYRRFYKTPETSLEFWVALQVELDKGSYELAGRWLRGLVDRKPSEKELTEIADRDGSIAVLRLRNVRNWTNDPNALDVTLPQAQKRLAEAKAAKEGVREAEALVRSVTVNTTTLQAANTLIEGVQAALRKRAGDAKYIRELIARLQATPEERTFALRELYKLGSPAVPFLLESIDQSTDLEERVQVRQALERMGSAALAPLVAALEGYKPATRAEVLDLLRKKHALSANVIAPFLVYPSANPKEDAVVRKKARDLYSDFTETPLDRVPSAKVLLTREAERYASHQVTFADPKAVTIWRWDEKAGVVMPGWTGAATLSQSQAEEYYGLRFARQALNLDPDYLPAQIVFLSLALDKISEKNGLARPLSAAAPELNDQLNKASTELLIEVLDRALREERHGVALPILRVLGARAELRAKRPLTKGEPALVRALYSKEPRVRLAAAQALLAIPGTPPPTTAKRILEILGHTLTPKAVFHEGRKILVAITDPEWRNKAKLSVRELNLQPVEASNGRDAMRLLRAGADIEAVLLDSTLPTPGLAHLLAQLRADADLARLPILVAAVPQSPTADAATRRYYDLNVVREALEGDLAEYRRRIRSLDAKEDQERREILEDRLLDRRQRTDLIRKIEERYQTLRRDAERMSPGVTNALARMEQTERQIASVANTLDLEAQVRESSLARFVSRYARVRVVPTSAFSSPATLTSELAAVADTVPLLSPEEQAVAAETAMKLLRGMAYGTPPGYDVQPLTAVILDSLRMGRLSPEGQIHAIEIAQKLPGSRPQQELAVVTLDAKRPAAVRLAAGRGLLAHRQRFGIQLLRASLDSLRAQANQAGVDPALKESLDLFIGSVGADPRSTGDRLRDYNPLPGGVPKKDPDKKDPLKKDPDKKDPEKKDPLDE
jgi:CheY-like chemotaxis protein